MPPDNFSFNSIDIESALLNIGSCNLVTPKPPVIPRFRENLPVVNFFTPPKHIESLHLLSTFRSKTLYLSDV